MEASDFGREEVAYDTHGPIRDFSLVFTFHRRHSDRNGRVQSFVDGCAEGSVGAVDAPAEGCVVGL